MGRGFVSTKKRKYEKEEEINMVIILPFTISFILELQYENHIYLTIMFIPWILYYTHTYTSHSTTMIII